jgi:hypothetical protein
MTDDRHPEIRKQLDQKGVETGVEVDDVLSGASLFAE